MQPRERFLRTLNFESCDDRLPMVEWAAWWHLTIDRWKTEGLPADISWDDSLAHFGLDPLVMMRGDARLPDPLPDEITERLARAPNASVEVQHTNRALVASEADYEMLRPYLYSETHVAAAVEQARALKPRHDRGEISIRVWLDGYFWFPRKLFGIEEHLLAFYDHPELMHRMNGDLADFNVRMIEAIGSVLTPDMVGFAEDMSYNHGPMLSQRCFEEFLQPHYRRSIPAIKARGSKVLVDTDGDVTTMIPWMQAAGIEGVYPLEHQAGVDVAELRRRHPDLLMMGGYDKMVMTRGEAAMRAEFERLLPVMRSGGFIPSVDHQTPPGVSLAEYEIYIRLFREYCERAVG